MSKASDAYRALTEAMDDTPPACLGNDLFTKDTPSKNDAASMSSICKTCPLFDLCRAYAQVDRPKAGFWAGKQSK